MFLAVAADPTDRLARLREVILGQPVVPLRCGGRWLRRKRGKPRGGGEHGTRPPMISHRALSSVEMAETNTPRCS